MDTIQFQILRDKKARDVTKLIAQAKKLGYIGIDITKKTC